MKIKYESQKLLKLLTLKTMSIYWKYVSSFVVNTTRISKIECNRILHCNPPIYDWKVTMKNGDVHNINESLFKKLDDFDLIDQKALYDAIENNKKLTKNGFEEIKNKIF